MKLRGVFFRGMMLHKATLISGSRLSSPMDSLICWIVQHAAYQINRYLIRSDGRTSYEKVFKKPQKSSIGHFGERVLTHTQAQPPAQKLQIRSSPQKSFGLWLGKDVVTGVRVVSLIDGQILKTCAIARLVRENQFNVDEEFKKFRVATHESSANYQDSSHDPMLFKDIVQQLLLQQKNNVKHESAESDSGGSFFRSYSRINGFMSRGSDFSISSKTFRINSSASRTTATSATSTNQKTSHWKTNPIRIRDQHDQLSQARRLGNQQEVSQQQSRRSRSGTSIVSRFQASRMVSRRSARVFRQWSQGNHQERTCFSLLILEYFWISSKSSWKIVFFWEVFGSFAR